MLRLTTSYCIVNYPDTKTLKRFNRSLYLRKELRRAVKQRKPSNLKEEVILKVNWGNIVARIQQLHLRKQVLVAIVY